MMSVSGKIVCYFLAAACLTLMAVRAPGQTSKYISEVEYNKVNTALLNPSNIQMLPFININNVFLYNKSLKIWKGSLNWNLRLSLLNQFSEDEFKGNTLDKHYLRFDPNELYYQKSLGNFTLGLGRKRIKWGVGYVASPTDIVSVPPSPEDPSDRLMRLKGSDLLQVSYVGTKAQYDLYLMPATNVNNNYFKDHSAAFRYFVNVHPFDISVVGRFDLKKSYQVGFNQAMTLGEKLELHSDAILISQSNVVYPPSFERERKRSYRLLAGLNWSPKTNYNIVLEYFHINEGYTGNQWDQLQELISFVEVQRSIDSLSPIATATMKSLYSRNVFPLRQNFIFARLFREDLIKGLELEWITFYGLDDHGTMNRFGTYYKFKSRYNLYLHYQFLANKYDSSFNLFGFSQTARLGIKISL